MSMASENKKKKYTYTGNCLRCECEFTTKTLNKWSGHCKKCFDANSRMSVSIPMEIDSDSDSDDRILHTIGEHRQAWLTYFRDRFETVCPKCSKVVIDVFTFQSDTIDGSLVPICKECCHPSYRRRSDPLNQQVWMTYIGKSAEVPCPIGCHNRINVFNFEKGHVVASYNNGPRTVENLRPICAPCNKSMGTENMLDYIARFQKPSYPFK